MHDAAGKGKKTKKKKTKKKKKKKKATRHERGRGLGSLNEQATISSSVLLHLVPSLTRYHGPTGRFPP